MQVHQQTVKLREPLQLRMDSSTGAHRAAHSQVRYVQLFV
jgi:hypothetical protein